MIKKMYTFPRYYFISILIFSAHTLDHRVRFPCVSVKVMIEGSLGRMQGLTVPMLQNQDWKQQCYDPNATKASCVGNPPVNKPLVCSLDHIYGIPPLSAPLTLLANHSSLGPCLDHKSKCPENQTRVSIFFLKHGLIVYESHGYSDSFKMGKWFQPMCCCQNMS